MSESLKKRCGTVFLMLVVSVLAACSSSPRRPAPVEDRARASSPPRVATPATVAPSVGAPGAAGAASTNATPTTTATEAVSARTPAGAENAGRAGFYTVRPGDTLIRIALDSGQNWRDIARWNNLDNPNVIEVGQVLRVAPPSVSVAAAPATASESGVTTRAVPPTVMTPVPVPPAPGAASAPAESASGPAAAASASPPASSTVAIAPPSATQPVPPAVAPAVPAGDEQVAWGWPAPGNTSVIASFDEVRNKGVSIAGRAGDPVLASADGRVVYAGAGLRGYGNLIILKHNNTYLTAYAHNQTLLVKEDQVVRKGQKIAEMGATDTDRVKLHFEIRRQGRPVDPTRYVQAGR